MDLIEVKRTVHFLANYLVLIIIICKQYVSLTSKNE